MEIQLVINKPSKLKNYQSPLCFLPLIVKC